MPTPSTERDALFATIKQIMQAKGLIYRDLAEHLGLSESGVKKMFSATNCTLERLFEIAGFLGITLEELIQATRRPEATQVTLTLEDQEWFLKHPVYFAWYWWLTTTRQSARALRERHGRSREEMQRVLNALHDRGLIELGLEDHVTLPGDGYIRWEEYGPLLDDLHRRWGSALVHDAVEHGAEVLRLQQLELTREGTRELAAELEEMLDRYARRAEIARVTAPRESLRPLRVLAVAARGRFQVRFDE